MDKKERRELFIHSPLPWWEWNVVENTVDFNDLKATMLGYTPESLRLKGYQAFTDLLHREDFEKTMDAMRALLEGRTDLYQVDYRIRAADGSYHWYMDRGIVIELEGPRIKTLRGIVIDLGQEASLAESGMDILVTLLNNSVNRRRNISESILTLCSSCQNAKVDNATWIPLSEEVSHLIGEVISHGICPDCLYKLYPDMAEDILRNLGLEVR